MRSLTRTSMKAAALAAVACLALAACGSSSSSSSSGTKGAETTGGYGTLPAETGSPTTGGTVSIAEAPGAGPTYIFPITPAANSSVYTAYQFQNLMWRPLWWGPLGDEPTIDLSQSIATGAPVFTNNNKTVTITMSSKWKWSDGTPVTASDVVFFIDVLKAAVKLNPANYGDYTPGYFPDNVTSAVATSPTTLVLTMNKTYNASWLYLDQLALAYPLPAQAWARSSANGPLLDYTKPANALAIYKYLNEASMKPATFATNPLWQTVDGPFKLKSFNPSTEGNTMVPNPTYSGPVKPHIAELDNVAFTSTASEFTALKAGSLTVGFVDFSDLPQVPQLKAAGYNVWGYPDFGFSYIVFNFKDKTADWNNVIHQLYIRQALDHLQDEAGVVSGLFKGAAGLAYGPVPAIPASPYAPASATTPLYPFSITAASTLLTSHGWKVVPNGVTTCQSPGTGPTECGAGIPKGTAITMTLPYTNSPAVVGEQDIAFASNAKEVGITVHPISKTFDYLLSTYGDPSFPANDNEWSAMDFGGFTGSYYPTTNELFNTTGSFNEGDYSDKTADADITASVTGLNDSAVTTEIAYITAQLPGIFQPNPDLIFAWKNTLSGPPASFADLSQYQDSPEYWYFTKQ